MSNFIKLCLSGDVLLEDVDDYIDVWHESDSELELHEFLGMTKIEYSLFLKDEEYLALIITARKEKKDVAELIKNSFAMAARAENHSKSKLLEDWLKEEGFWD